MCSQLKSLTTLSFKKKSYIYLECPTGFKKYVIFHSLRHRNCNSQFNVRQSQAFTHSLWHNILKYWFCLFLLSSCQE